MAEAARIRLRRFAPEDAGPVHRWFSNPRATGSLMERRESFSAAEAAAWTERAAAQRGEDRKFAIEVAGTAEPVGFTALYGLFRQTAPELGVLVGDRAPRGAGRQAEALTIARAFDEYGAHRVYGRIPAGNRAAKWVVESLGWRREATMRAHLRRPDGELEDCEIWGVLPEEFRAAAADLLPAVA